MSVLRHFLNREKLVDEEIKNDKGSEIHILQY